MHQQLRSHACCQGSAPSGLNPPARSAFALSAHRTHAHTPCCAAARADYSRMFMKLACAYLEGTDMFEEEASSRGAEGQLIDPRVSAQGVYPSMNMHHGGDVGKLRQAAALSLTVS